MTERDALLRAILTTPGDDLPRLVFADWLDDNGDAARGNLIRVQCELAATLREPGWVPPLELLSRHPVGDVEILFRLNNYDRESLAETLRRRERELLGGAGGAKYLLGPDGVRAYDGGQPLPQWLLPDFYRAEWPRTGAVEFRRGFVARVRCDLAALLDAEGVPTPAAVALFNAHPVESFAAACCSPYPARSDYVDARADVGPDRWVWVRGHRRLSVHPTLFPWLPARVFDALAGKCRLVPSRAGHDSMMVYGTEGEAVDALSHAVVDLIRTDVRVGLPPLYGADEPHPGAA